LVKKSGIPRENHRPVASHWRTLSHNVVSNTPRRVRYLLVALIYVFFILYNCSLQFFYLSIFLTQIQYFQTSHLSVLTFSCISTM
jgi:hypothetical protein